MYKAVILHYDFTNLLPPTAKEMQDYFKKSTRLLYGNDKRRSKLTPIPEKLHLVERSFQTFGAVLGEKDVWSTKLYVFDDKANSSMLSLKYANQVICHFKLDEQIAEEMWNTSWEYEHLQRYKLSLQSNIDETRFFSEKNIGRKFFHQKGVPPFAKATNSFISYVEREIATLELEARRLFKSGWD